MTSGSQTRRQSKPKRFPVIKYKRKTGRSTHSRQEVLVKKTFKFPQCNHISNVCHITMAVCTGTVTITGTLLGIGGSYYGAGFLGSLLFALTGSVGFCAYRQKNLCTFVFYVGVTSLSMAAAVFVIVVASVKLGPDMDKLRHVPRERNKVILIHVLSLCIGVLELINCGVADVILYKVYKESTSDKSARKITARKTTTERVSRSERNSSRNLSHGRSDLKQHRLVNGNRKPKDNIHEDPDTSMFIAGDNHDPFNDLNISVIQPVPDSNTRGNENV